MAKLLLATRAGEEGKGSRERKDNLQSGKGCVCDTDAQRFVRCWGWKQEK